MCALKITTWSFKQILQLLVCGAHLTKPCLAYDGFGRRMHRTCFQYVFKQCIIVCINIVFCTDFLVSHITRESPLKVSQRKKTINSDSLFNSWVAWVDRKSCFQKLIKLFGYIPLVNNMIRLEPLLYKDSVSLLRKKYKKWENIAWPSWPLCVATSESAHQTSSTETIDNKRAASSATYHTLVNIRSKNKWTNCLRWAIRLFEWKWTLKGCEHIHVRVHFVAHRSRPYSLLVVAILVSSHLIMGNCLKTVPSHDDISLLRDSAPTAQDSSDQISNQLIRLQLNSRNPIVSCAVLVESSAELTFCCFFHRKTVWIPICSIRCPM